MGMKNLPDIARNLIEAGLSPDTPAALVHWGTTAKHRASPPPSGRSTRKASGGLH